MHTYQINEIFSSLQGEGLNTGRPVVIVRFSGCNLGCVWCDTPFNDYDEMDEETIMAIVSAFEIKSVIFSGGEPTIHENMLVLARRFKENGYWLAIETNGVNALSEEAERLFDYIAVSPKAFYAALYEKPSAASFADEVRVVVDGDVEGFCEFIESRIIAQYYFLSPCCNIEEKFNMFQTIQIMGRLNMRKGAKKWHLSLQSHKIADIQ